ncbi:MAG: hypothetical protein LBT40_05255 [Deltaproteobacteria bacterium]|jgi:hypothetical protein|nr:hypothetical protein [Deltaproteobacteria bacterium]
MKQFRLSSESLPCHASIFLALSAALVLLIASLPAAAQGTCQTRKISDTSSETGVYLASGYEHRDTSSFFFEIRLDSGQTRTFGAISEELANSFDIPNNTQVEFTWVRVERPGYDSDACTEKDVIETIRRAR